MNDSAGFPSTAAAGTFDRRRFLDALLTVGFVSTAAAIAYPVSRYLVPPQSGEAATNSVVATKASALKPNSGIIFPFGSKPATEGRPKIAKWWTRVQERPSVKKALGEQQAALAAMQRGSR